MDDPILYPFGDNAEDDPDASEEEKSEALQIYYQNVSLTPPSLPSHQKSTPPAAVKVSPAKKSLTKPADSITKSQEETYISMSTGTQKLPREPTQQSTPDPTQDAGMASAHANAAEKSLTAITNAAQLTLTNDTDPPPPAMLQ